MIEIYKILSGKYDATESLVMSPGVMATYLLCYAYVILFLEKVLRSVGFVSI